MKKFKSNQKIIFRIFSYIWKYKYRLILSIVLCLTSSILGLIAPLYIKEMSTMLLNFSSQETVGFNMDEFMAFFAIALSLYFISSALMLIQSIISQDISCNYGYDIRKNLADRFVHLPISFFDEWNTGDLIARFTYDVDSLSQSLNFFIMTFFPSCSVFIGSIIVMLIINPYIGLTIIGVTPIAFVFLLFITIKSSKHYINRQKCTGEIYGLCDETYALHNVITTLNVKDYFISRFNRLNQELNRSSTIAEIVGTSIGPVMTLFKNLNLAILLLVFSFILNRSEASPSLVSQIVITILYSSQLIAPLLSMIQVSTVYETAVAAGQRVFSLQDLPLELDNNDCLTSIKDFRGNIEFKDVNFTYPNGHKVISNFSYNVNRGEKIAIVGHTGAGKTTLVNLMMRFYELDSGEILIDGINIKKLKRKYLHSLFAMVLQDSWVFNDTFMNNIKLNDSKITDEAVYQACKMTKCDSFIEKMGGYNTMITNTTNLSYGQLQLLSIARAIVRNPSILILDEATSQVDTLTEKIVQETMDVAMIGRTSFIIAHRLSTIKNADAIIVMKNGKIVEIGKHDELLVKKDSAYAEMYYSSFIS